MTPANDSSHSVQILQPFSPAVASSATRSKNPTPFKHMDQVGRSVARTTQHAARPSTSGASRPALACRAIEGVGCLETELMAWASTFLGCTLRSHPEVHALMSTLWSG
jgi:hypothetical protein